MLDLRSVPFSVNYRELWLPETITNNAILPTSKYRGHPLTLTGAKKGTTCDGVHFDGSTTSNINCGAIHNAAPKIWISLRFKLDQDWGVGDGDLQLFGKRITDNDMIYLQLRSTGGDICARQVSGGVEVFNIMTVETGFNAGQWYHVLLSVSDTGGGTQRLILDGGTPVTDTQPAANLPNGGDFVIGDLDDPGSGAGFKGTISDVFIGTDDLTTDEETNLYKGVPPADTVNSYLLDEGCGVTAYDRGSGGNNGTLDSSTTWKFGRVAQPVLSLDGLNDYAQSSPGVDISGDLTLVWVGKMKSTFDDVLENYLFVNYVDSGNIVSLHYSPPPNNFFHFVTKGGGVAKPIEYSGKPIIDDYLIFIGTISNSASLYVNGSLVGSVSGVIGRVGAATSYCGSNQTHGAIRRNGAPLLLALIDGAFTEKQAKLFSRWLDQKYGLGLGI